MAGALSFVSTLDNGIFVLVNRSLHNPLFDVVMPILSDKRAGLLLAAVVSAWLLYSRGKRAWAVVLVGILAVGLSDLGATALKHAFPRMRPCHVIAGVRLLVGCTMSSAMPSNHASNMFAIVGATLLLPSAWRWATLILACGVAYSRVYLGVHYPSDIIVGAVWGGAVGGAIALAAKRMWGKRVMRGRPDSEQVESPARMGRR